MSDARSREPEPGANPNYLQRRLRRRAERIKQREIEEAISKLEARGGLTEDQRETVRTLAAALVRDLTAAPESALKRTARSDRERARIIGRLFDIDTE